MCWKVIYLPPPSPLLQAYFVLHLLFFFSHQSPNRGSYFFSLFFLLPLLFQVCFYSKMCTAQVKRAHAQQPANKSIGQNIFPILRSRKKKKRIRSRLRCIWHTGLYVFPNLGEIKLQTQKYVVSFSLFLNCTTSRSIAL